MSAAVHCWQVQCRVVKPVSSLYETYSVGEVWVVTGHYEIRHSGAGDLGRFYVSKRSAILSAIRWGCQLGPCWECSVIEVQR